MITLYTETQYNTEKELEILAVKNQRTLFGENTIYFDKKMLITSIAKISKVPDGLFLAVDSRDLSFAGRRVHLLFRNQMIL